MRLEPDLGELEPDYRKHFLKADTGQFLAIAPIYIAAMLIYIAIDFQVYGFSGNFWLLTLGRVVMIALAVFLMGRFRRAMTPSSLDAWLLLASGASFSLGLLVHFVRAQTVDYNLAVTVVLIVGHYLLVPAILYKRIGLALFFSLLEVLIFLLMTKTSIAAEIRNNIIALVLANVIGVIISIRLATFRRNQYKAQLEERRARQEIERLAITDSLTGIFNRRKWLEDASRVLARYLRNKQIFSLMYLDIDHFKRLNDTQGHAFGDMALQHFAQLVGQQIRELDVFGRFGGEEFVLLLPDTALANAKSLAQRIRAATESSTIAHSGVRLTVSIGVTEVALEDAKIEDVLHRADQALYKAKSLGRNRVEAL